MPFASDGPLDPPDFDEDEMTDEEREEAIGDHQYHCWVDEQVEEFYRNYGVEDDE